MPGPKREAEGDRDLEGEGPVEGFVFDLLDAAGASLGRRMPPLLRPMVREVVDAAKEAISKIEVSSKPQIDAYKVLGVKPSDSWDHIHRRYLVLSKQVHPDRGGTDELFQILKRAHDELEKKYKK